MVTVIAIFYAWEISLIVIAGVVLYYTYLDITEVKCYYDEVKKITSDIIDRTDYKFNLDTIVKAYFHNAGRYILDPVEKERFENPLQPLHPCHGPMPLFWRLFQPVAGCNFSLPSSLSPLARGDLNSVFTVRGEYTVATG